jgi:diadenosine tetraphosphate (Ap4A) HIT family hydrolase
MINYLTFADKSNMASLRLPSSTRRYKQYQLKAAKVRGCFLCKKTPRQHFKYWKIVRNSFPYDQIARVHNMLVPHRHVSEQSLNRAELAELRAIKRTFVNERYDYVIESTEKNRSVPDHFHLHLIVGRT